MQPLDTHMLRPRQFNNVFGIGKSGPLLFSNLDLSLIQLDHWGSRFFV